MHKRILRFTSVSCMIAVLTCTNAHALDSITISGVQVKGVGTNVSSQEAVEVRNYGDSDVDVTNWCVTYTSYTSTTVPTGGNCILPFSPGDKVFLKKQSGVVLTTAELTASLQQVHPGFAPDAALSSGLGNTTGQLYLLDGSRQLVNNVKWYSSTTIIDGQINLRPATGQAENISFSRTGAPTAGIPSFIVSSQPLAFTTGGLYDAIDVCKNIAGFQDTVPVNYNELDGACTAIDVCSNVDGIQLTVPSGLYQFENKCVADMCANITDLQVAVPDGYVKDAAGSCLRDVCTNIEGIQQLVPVGYTSESTECFQLENRALRINELLANASGSDTGLEYIELYNPFDETIALKGYTLSIGKNFEKVYELPVDQEIPARGYMVFTNAQIPFTLLNTTSGVRLTTPAGTVSSETSYADPADDMSWSLIDGAWQYTNQKTPGQSNQVSIADTDATFTNDDKQVATLASCGAGKYRHPLTNRCRNVETDVVTFAGCDADEYRNPETNRCRKISATASLLAPCDATQERNPETNRCRKILASTDSALTPCATGYERNPETNRCRKIVASAANAAAVGDIQNESQSSNNTRYIGFAAFGAVIVYGIYEWRTEIVKLFRRFLPMSQ